MNINEALNVFNLKGTVTKEELNQVYKKLAVKYHPDKNPSGLELMKVINAAYEFLKGLDKTEYTHTDENNAYNYSESLETVINEIKKMTGIIIEICGNWIWLSGQTKPYKEQLKALGCLWAAKKLQWYYRPPEHKSSNNRKSWEMDDIRNKYGSSIINADDRKILSGSKAVLTQ